MPNYMPNTTVYNKTQDKQFVLQESLPEGAWLMNDEETGEQFYMPEEELVQSPDWVSEYDMSMTMAAIREELNLEDVDNLREDYVEYYAQWQGTKPAEVIYSDFVEQNDIADTFMLGELRSVTETLDATASIGNDIPVLIHLTVDRLPLTAKVLLDNPEVCSSVSQSKYPGYDFMVVGFPRKIREVLTDNEVYVDMMNVKSIPRNYNYSYVEASVKKLGLSIPKMHILEAEAYVNYNNLDSKEFFNELKSLKAEKNIMSLRDLLRSISVDRLAILNKELPMTVEDFDNRKGDEESEISPYGTGVEDTVLKFFLFTQ